MFDPSKYCESVPFQHRKSLGQFFTPSQVADFMVGWVLESGRKDLYDPAYGLGAFHPKNKNIPFSASEMDPIVLEHSKREREGGNFSVRLENYLTVWGGKYGNIVCNPPYMRFQKFLDRSTVFTGFQENLDLRLSGYTNTASAFLIKSLSELKEQGRLAYLMPLEFLNTGYGVLVKKLLLKNGHLMAVLQLECEKDIFPEATTSVGIVLYDATKPYKEVRFYNIRNINELSNFHALQPTSRISVEKLDSESKWLPYLQTAKVSFDASQMVSLFHYGRFSRGIATGANEFFILKPSKVKSLGLLPKEYLRCISRSSQISRPVFSQGDFDTLLSADAPVLLFTTKGALSNPAKRYIQEGESKGYQDRFLTKNRNPWYKTERRRPAPLLVGVFSRGGYKIILNRSEVLNLTCYHGFYPHLFGLKVMEPLFLYFLSEAGRSIVSLSLRKYGDSLDKFEPNDLNSSWVPSEDFFNTMSQEILNYAIQEVEKNGVLPTEMECIFQKLKA
jgi:adenine-specific DNA-methyltransferase